MFRSTPAVMFPSSPSRWPHRPARARCARAWQRLALAVALIAGAQAHAASLDLDERIACQAAIEDVQWSHSTWPDVNPEPKPPRAAVLPDDAIRDQVMDSLRMGAALEALYGIRIDAPMLQAELDRMAASTRAPEQLRELYAVLGDDPHRIAECLARPNLVVQQLYDAYVWDADRHDPLRAQAEADIARTGAFGNGPVGVESHTVVYRRDSGGAGERAKVGSDDDSIETSLSPEQWDERFGSRSRAGGPVRLDTPHNGAGARAILEETADNFFHETVIERDETRVVVQVLSWPKVSFDDWWEKEAPHWPVTTAHAADVPLTLAPVGGEATDIVALSKAGAEERWRSIMTAPAPFARKFHTAVWTGTEMIIWGGSGNGLLNSGGRYKPVTNTWSAMPIEAFTPSPRQDHTAIWTGTEMIIWGGKQLFNFVNTGGRFNPSTGKWASGEIQTAGAPSKRSVHTAVWTGSEMIIWGGHDNSGALNTGGRYNPESNHWSTMTAVNAPAGRFWHSAVWTGDDMIAYGGRGEIEYLGDTYRYNPSSDTWTELVGSESYAKRYKPSVVWTGSQMIIWGGSGDDNLRDGMVYTPGLPIGPLNWRSTSLANAPEGRHWHTAVWTGSEMIVSGGYELDEPTPGGRYNPMTDSWIAVAASPLAARSVHTAVWTGSEMIVWGGESLMDSSLSLNTGGRYNPSTNTWQATAINAPYPVARRDHTAVWTGADMLIWGGFDGNQPLRSGGRYRPSTDSWSPIFTNGAPSARNNHSAVWTGTQMIVWGGHDGVAPLANGGRYTPTGNGSWSTIQPAGAPPARQYHSAVWSGDQMIVWGGTGSDNNYLNTGARYMPGSDNWLAMSTTNVPAPRLWHTALWTGNQMIVWGGAGELAYDTGGRYNPVTDQWTATATTGAPTGRFRHTAVWTGDEMIVWGGAAPGFVPQASGGRYSPVTNSWAGTPATGAPSGRYDHTAVWTGEEMLIWGGLGAGVVSEQYQGARLGQLNGWTPMTTAGTPQFRSRHTAVWTGDEMLIWGGFCCSIGYLDSLGAYSPGSADAGDVIFEHDFELPDDEP